MISTGCIGISNRPTGWYPRAVRFFTRSKWSHCFILANSYLERNCVLEADLKVQLVDFEKEYIKKVADSWRIYDPVQATSSEKNYAAAETFKEYNGQTYGFLQILGMAIRIMLRWLGISKNMRNLFPSGVICSELVLYYLKALGGEYEDAFKHLSLDETSPDDIYQVIYDNPKLFRFVGGRDL